MTYFYYNKVLVTNCQLKKLYGYAGKIFPGFAVQLIVRLTDENDALPDAPTGISDHGEYYHMAPAPKLLYEIHKSGKLVRAFTTELSLVEDTIMLFPPEIKELLRKESAGQCTKTHLRNRTKE